MKVKKIIKLIGNILTVFALVLIARKLVLIDTDYSVLLQPGRILWALFLVVVYAIHVLALPFAWYLILPITTGRKFPFPVVQQVYCKSNLLKYIPGNVFQYVGRNEIAVLYDVRHRDVALSTVLDVIASVLGIFSVSVICYSAGLQIGLQSIRAYLSWPIVLSVLLVGGVAAWLLFIKRALYWEQVKYLCTRRNLIQLGICIIYYMLAAVCTGTIYFIILSNILAVNISKETAFIVVGAHLLSWLLGFLMPGSPGGIGVRESAFVALLAAYVPADPTLLAIVLYRIINTLGDVLAFFGNLIICFVWKKKTHTQR